MKISKQYLSGIRANPRLKGFSLIETLLVIGLALAFASLTIPVGVNFFQKQTLDSAAGEILAALRQARGQAVVQRNDSSFGIKFLSDSYVLFQGDSYASRVQVEDRIYPLTEGAATSGMEEAVFLKRTGIPSITGTATLTVILDNNSESISVNNQGKIEWE